MEAWLDSPGHRANILDCELTKLGVGVAQRVCDAIGEQRLHARPAGMRALQLVEQPGDLDQLDNPQVWRCSRATARTASSVQ